MQGEGAALVKGGLEETLLFQWEVTLDLEAWLSRGNYWVIPTEVERRLENYLLKL